ncbi:MAG: transporter substrate-binding domain-containing protein [Bacteroidales bacterium]
MIRNSVFKKLKKHTLTQILTFLSLFLFATGCSNIEHKSYRCLKDAANDRIGVLKGSIQDSLITKEYPNAQIIRMDINDLVSALIAGNCDVIILGSIDINKILPLNPDLKILQNLLYSPSLAAGFNQEDTILLERFNTFLSQIQRDGTYNQIMERWIYKSELDSMPTIDLPIQGKPLRIGTTATHIPFSYEKNGKLSGLDIEIMTRFAAFINRPVLFQKMSFDELIPALINNKVDVIVNNITVTTERKKKIAFSNVYFQYKSTAIVMGKNMANTKDSSKY